MGGNENQVEKVMLSVELDFKDHWIIQAFRSGNKCSSSRNHDWGRGNYWCYKVLCVMPWVAGDKVGDE